MGLAGIPTERGLDTGLDLARINSETVMIYFIKSQQFSDLARIINTSVSGGASLVTVVFNPGVDNVDDSDECGSEEE